jgi:heptaprenyl diphosphate synthase
VNAPTILAGIELADPALAVRVADGLARVEAVLEREMASEFDFVTEAASHLMHAGGKRFRPLFTLVAAGVGPHPESEQVIVASAVVELIHLATLYHDDVMDEADLRRGAKSANARWDNSIAILTGDFLFAHASRLVADLGPDAVRIIAETFAELVTGQTRETVGPRPGTDPIAHHLTVLDEKTASLIDTCARYAGIFSGATAEQTSALRRFGRAVGVASVRTSPARLRAPTCAKGSRHCRSSTPSPIHRRIHDCWNWSPDRSKQTTRSRRRSACSGSRRV